MTVNISKRNWGALLLTGALLTGTLAGLPQVQAQPGAAQARPQIVPTLKAFRVVAKANGESLVEGGVAKPGDVIEYRVAYANKGGVGVRGLKATLPIPAGMTYVANSASPGGVQASTDGKTFAPAPLMRAEKQADGTIKRVPVPLSEYRALRWNVGALNGGATTEVSARARINFAGR